MTCMDCGSSGSLYLCYSLVILLSHLEWMYQDVPSKANIGICLVFVPEARNPSRWATIPIITEQGKCVIRARLKCGWHM